MSGLILKDLFAMKKQFRVVGLISIVYMGIGIMSNNSSFLLYLVFFFNIALILAAFSYDEKPGFEKYARILPISYKTLALARYVETLVINAICLAVVIPFSIYVEGSGKAVIEIVSACTAAVSVGMILLAILFPIIYRFGIEKGRIMIFAIVFIPVFVFAMLNKMNLSFDINKIMTDPIFIYVFEHAYIIAPVIALIFLGISYFASISIIAKKEY